MEFVFHGDATYLTRWYEAGVVQEHLWVGNGGWQIEPDGGRVEVIMGFEAEVSDFSQVRIREPGLTHTIRSMDWPLAGVGGFSHGGFAHVMQRSYTYEDVEVEGEFATVGQETQAGRWAWSATYVVPAGGYVAVHTHHALAKHHRLLTWNVNQEEQVRHLGWSDDGTWVDGTIHGWTTTEKEVHVWTYEGVGLIAGGVPEIAPPAAEDEHFYIAFAWFSDLDPPGAPRVTY